MPKMALAPHPVALTIAGSDSGGGAGIQADLRAFRDFGVHGCSAITAITAQNPHGVRAIQAVEPKILRAQLEAVAEDFALGAVKTGMLLNEHLIAEVANFRRTLPAVPWVIDPVMIATSGARLLEPAAIRRMEADLLPTATVITPNIPEAMALLGESAAPADVEAMHALAIRLAERLQVAVLLKGGHFAEAPALDLLVQPGCAPIELREERVQAPLTTHGTGCALAAAIAANLALGQPLLAAIREAKRYIVHLLSHTQSAGRAAVYAQAPFQPGSRS